MTPEPYRTQPISIGEAMSSSLGSAQIVRRIEEAGPRPRLLTARTSGAPLRRSTYQPLVAERVLVLAATLALAAAGAAQAYALTTLF